MFAPFVLCVYFLIGYAYWRRMEDEVRELMATGDEQTESLAAEYQQIVDMVGENEAYFLFSFVVTVFWLPFEITMLFRRWTRAEQD
jgi:TRAP-type mannitol/chloroaromatic compound transport system permease small subunit